MRLSQWKKGCLLQAEGQGKLWGWAGLEVLNV
jgi:hypothetical protein